MPVRSIVLMLMLLMMTPVWAVVMVILNKVIKFNFFSEQKSGIIVNFNNFNIRADK